MNATQLIWVIAVIVVVLVVLGLILYFGSNRRRDAQRAEAARLRDSARSDELAAQEVEAKAARADAEARRADADAKQAAVDAQRLREEASGRQEQAETTRAHSDEQLRKADRLDPDAGQPGGGVRSEARLGEADRTDDPGARETGA